MAEKRLIKISQHRIILLLIMLFFCFLTAVLTFVNVSYRLSNRREVEDVLTDHTAIIRSGLAGEDMTGPGMQPDTPGGDESSGGSENGPAGPPEGAETAYLNEARQSLRDSGYDTTEIYTLLIEAGEMSVLDISPTAALAEETVLEIGEAIVSQGKKGGIYKQYQYNTSEEGSSTVISFLDVSQLLNQMRLMLARSVLIGFFAMVLWSFASMKISGKLIEPMVTAFDKQREFVMMAGHELKTPLTVMQTSFHMLRKEGWDSKYLTYAEEEQARMKQLVTEMLDISRMEEEHAPSLERMNLSECVEGTALLFEAAAYEKGLLFEMDIDESVFIEGNEPRLERLAGILIDNAICHTAPGGTVAVRLGREDGTALLSVENEGTAIPKEERERIFEKFYQAGGGESGRYGLGLAIAKRIATQHGSDISVDYFGGRNRFSVKFQIYKTLEAQ